MSTIDPVLSREFALFERSLKRLIAETDRSVGDIVRQEARLFCVDLIHKTQPFGRTKKANEKGSRAVYRDVGRVYANPGRVYKEVQTGSDDAAKALYYLLKNNRYSEAEEMLRTVGTSMVAGLRVRDFDGGKEHQSRRRLGRVDGVRPSVVIPNPQNRTRYSESIAKRVGTAKRSWAVGLPRLGSMARIPKWLRRGRHGSMDDHTRGRRPLKGVVFSSHISYIHRVLKERDVKRSLMQRSRSIEKRLAIMHRKGLKRI